MYEAGKHLIIVWYNISLHGYALIVNLVIKLGSVNHPILPLRSKLRISHVRFILLIAVWRMGLKPHFLQLMHVVQGTPPGS